MPVRVATAIPYALILTLMLMAFFYYILSYIEYRNSKRNRELLIRQNNLLLGSQNFIALTSHHLNSPISTMQAAIYMLKDDKRISKAKAELVLKSLRSISKATASLLEHNSQATEKIILDIDTEPRQISTGRYLLSPTVWIPTVIATLLLITANIVFLRANIFTLNLYSVSSQILLLLVGIILVLMVWRSYQYNQLLKAKRERALQKEKDLNKAKAKFIASASGVMQKDLKVIQEASTSLKGSKEAQEFQLALASLLSVKESLQLLKSFNNYHPASNLGTKELQKAINSSIQTNAGHIKAKKLDVHTHLKGGASMNLDHKALDVLVGTVIGNAVKFNRKGGKVDIYAQKSGNQVIIEVRDSGVGISNDKLKSIMTPFSRATNAMKYDQEGLGLSLYLDRIILDQLGGHILIKSKPKQGTKLIMSIPS